MHQDPFVPFSAELGSQPRPEPEPAPRTPTEALLHRWLVEYNPFYLLSAMLVLGGIWILAREAARNETLVGALGVGALAELYALSAIAGAAFLTRIDQRRSAVMLGLLAVVFQADPTLHLETCAYLGAVGVAASAVWLGLFALKLHLLLWALQLRASRSALVLPMVGGLGLALIPHLLRVTSGDVRTVLVCGWAFALMFVALSTRRDLLSTQPWDPRAQRAVKATWLLWGVLGLAHVVYWAANYRVNLWLLAPGAVLLWLPRLRHERDMWATVAVALTTGYACVPLLFGAVLGMVCFGLVVCALRPVLMREVPPGALGYVHPYRGVPRDAWVGPVCVPDDAAHARVLLGALLSAYGALYLPDASASPLPLHDLAQLLPFVALLLVGARALRRYGLATPALPLGLHALGQRGLLPWPESALAWGITSTSAGFVVLFAALYGSWRVGAPGRSPAAAPAITR